MKNLPMTLSAIALVFTGTAFAQEEQKTEFTPEGVIIPLADCVDPDGSPRGMLGSPLTTYLSLGPSRPALAEGCWVPKGYQYPDPALKP